MCSMSRYAWLWALCPFRVLCPISRPSAATRLRVLRRRLRATVQAASGMSDLGGFGGECPFCRDFLLKNSDIVDMPQGSPRKPVQGRTPPKVLPIQGDRFRSIWAVVIVWGICPFWEFVRGDRGVSDYRPLSTTLPYGLDLRGECEENRGTRSGIVPES